MSIDWQSLSITQSPSQSTYSSFLLSFSTPFASRLKQWNTHISHPPVTIFQLNSPLRRDRRRERGGSDQWLRDWVLAARPLLQLQQFPSLVGTSKTSHALFSSHWNWDGAKSTRNGPFNLVLPSSLFSILDTPLLSTQLATRETTGSSSIATSSHFTGRLNIVTPVSEGGGFTPEIPPPLPPLPFLLLIRRECCKAPSPFEVWEGDDWVWLIPFQQWIEKTIEWD